MSGEVCGAWSTAVSSFAGATQANWLWLHGKISDIIFNAEQSYITCLDHMVLLEIIAIVASECIFGRSLFGT